MKWTNYLKESAKTHTEADNLNINEIKSVSDNPPKQKVTESDGLTGEFYRELKEEIILILCILFQKIEAEGILSKSSYESSLTQIPKPDKDITEKETTDQNLSLAQVQKSSTKY